MKAVLLFNRDNYCRRSSHIWQDERVKSKKSVIKDYTYYSSHRRFYSVFFYFYISIWKL
jgi:hypothetical protein